jgi:uncharacterized membrane protein
MSAQRALFVSGFVLGVGFGGFFDGIVLHQLLQWHHVASSLIPPDGADALAMNTFWDGVFHMAMYAVAVLGLVLLWRALTRPGVRFDPRLIVCAIAIGFGAFHVFDSVVFHWLLDLHHICYGPNQALCDGGYFAIGLVLIAAGVFGLRTHPRTRTRTAGRTP